MLAVGLALALTATAAADDPPPDEPPLAIPAPEPPDEPPPALPAPEWRPHYSAKALAGQDMAKASTYVVGVGAGLIAVGAVGGVVSAATVGPCDGNGVCGQESVFGRVGVPIIVGAGGAMALSGVLMRVVGNSWQPRRPGYAWVVPMLERHGAGVAVAGRF